MENDMKNEVASLDNDDKIDTTRSSGTSEEATSPRPPYALHLAAEDKENERGDHQTTTRQNKSSRKPQSAESTHSLRAPYAQPVLDASKVDRIKSSVEERLASAKERRLLQRKQLEHDMKLRREKEDQAHSKWVQSQEDKRRKMEEGRAKEEAHRREVEQRKKQQIEGEKKKAEAKVAKTEQVYEVKMRQKRSASSDRGVKRWSWGGGGGGKDKRPSSLHASHFDVSRLNKYYETSEPKYASQVNLSSSAKSSDRFSHNPYHVNNSHMQFASGLRSYDSRESLSKGPSPESPRQRSSSVELRSTPPKRSSSMGNIPCKPATPTPSESTPVKRGRSPTPKGMLIPGSKGRAAVSANLAESIQISPRLLAPTRASLARSRVGETEDGSTHPSNVTDSKSGPMRSRSKDRRVRGHSANRPHTAPGVADQVSTNKKTRGVSPATKRPASTPSLQSLSAPTASSQAKSVDHGKATDEPAKPKRGVSPQTRPVRAPSPKPSRPDTAPARQKQNPSPVSTKPNVKAPSIEPMKSTPPNIKPSLRPALSHVRSKPAGKALSVKIAPELEKPSRKSMEIKKAASTKPTKFVSKKPAKVKTAAATVTMDTPSLEIVENDNKTDDKKVAATDEIQGSKSIELATQTGLVQEYSMESSEKSVDNEQSSKATDETLPSEGERPTPEGAVTSEKEIPTMPEQNTADDCEVPVTQNAISAENITPHSQPDQNIVEITKIQDDRLLIIEDADRKNEEDLGPQEHVAVAEATDSSHSVNDDEDRSESTSMSDATTVENVSVGSGNHDKTATENEDFAQNEEQSKMKDEEPPQNDLEIVESLTEPEVGPDSEIKMAAELGFRLNEPTEASSVVKATAPRSVSPADSLEEVEQESIEKVESMEKPEPKEAWNDENKENVEPSKESTDEQKPEDAAQDDQTTLEIVEPAETATPQLDRKASTDAMQQQPVAADDDPTSQSESVTSTEVQTSQPEVNAPPETASQAATAEVSAAQEEPTASDDVQIVESNAVASPPDLAKEDSEKPDVLPSSGSENSDKRDEKSEAESPPSSEITSATERKSLPRKNLETDEAKEAYRQAIAEKRRELKEKKELEEKERQERIRLAKIEQAKREEEARRMFEEAAAEAEREKKLEEEKQREREEEEKRREDEAAAKKRETAERLKREREMQKQKQEDERLARKKRLEMIMRRTRQPDGDASKSKSDDPASGSPSPRNTPVSQSPVSGRSPTIQSPVGGLSPMAATTPERSVSPSIAAILNRNSIDKSYRTSEGESRSFDNLPNFINSTNDSVRHASATIEKPVPIDRGMNGVEIRINESDPLGLATNGRQESSVDDLAMNQETLIPGL